MSGILIWLWFFLKEESKYCVNRKPTPFSYHGDYGERKPVCVMVSLPFHLSTSLSLPLSPGCYHPPLSLSNSLSVPSSFTSHFPALLLCVYIPIAHILCPYVSSCLHYFSIFLFCDSHSILDSHFLCYYACVSISFPRSFLSPTFFLYHLCLPLSLVFIYYKIYPPPFSHPPPSLPSG